MMRDPSMPFLASDSQMPNTWRRRRAEEEEDWVVGRERDWQGRAGMAGEGAARLAFEVVQEIVGARRGARLVPLVLVPLVQKEGAALQAAQEVLRGPRSYGLLMQRSFMLGWITVAGIEAWNGVQTPALSQRFVVEIGVMNLLCNRGNRVDLLRASPHISSGIIESRQ